MLKGELVMIREIQAQLYGADRDFKGLSHRITMKEARRSLGARLYKIGMLVGELLEDAGEEAV